MSLVTRTLPPPPPERVIATLVERIKATGVRFMVTPKVAAEPARGTRRVRRTDRA